MENKSKFRPDPDKKLMDQAREVLRYHHFAYKTEQSYCNWIVRYIRFYKNQRHPKDMGVTEVERFLSDLAENQKVALATQKQALNAIVFLYRDVLDMPLEGNIAPSKPRKPVRLPTVLTRDEVQKVLSQLEGTHALMAGLLYGSGLRLMECVRLRIKDVDFGQNLIIVRGGKGDKDRSTLLPGTVREDLEQHIEKVVELHGQDLKEGFGEVALPGALDRKYPKAPWETNWQYVFPAKKRSIDPRSGKERRHHVMESGLQKAVRNAAFKAGTRKRVTCHTLRHSFATHMLEAGVNIRMLQELLGHKDVKTTEVYTHVMQKDVRLLASPLDSLKLP